MRLPPRWCENAERSRVSRSALTADAAKGPADELLEGSCTGCYTRLLAISQSNSCPSKSSLLARYRRRLHLPEVQCVDRRARLAPSQQLQLLLLYEEAHKDPCGKHSEYLSEEEQRNALRRDTGERVRHR